MSGASGRRAAVSVALCLVGAVLIGGCANWPDNGASGSRATLYDDLAGIQADTAVIVAGEAIASAPGGTETGTAITLVTIRVDEVYDPAGLGDGLDSETRAAASPVEVRAGTEMLVKRYSSVNSSGAMSALDVGTHYLLFLVPTMDGGPPAAAQETAFYVVGADAGIYTVDGSTFTRTHPDSGDTLPQVLTPADLE